MRNEGLEFVRKRWLSTQIQHMDKTDQKLRLPGNDVYVVWSCKTLQNHKALLSTTIRMECIMS